MAFVEGYNLSLEMLGEPQLTPGQSDVLRKTLDEAVARHQRPGLAGLLGQAVERVRGRRRDQREAIKGFVSLVNERLEAANQPRLTEDQGDALGGMIEALGDSFEAG